MKTIIMLFLFASGINAFADVPFTADQFEADRFSDIISISEVISTEFIFDDSETTPTHLYKITFEGLFYAEGECAEAPTASGDACETNEVTGRMCLYMTYDLQNKTFTDTDYLCSADVEDVMDDLFPETLEDEY